MPMRTHVNIEKSSHEIYRSLAEGKTAPFRTMKDVFMLAAMVGYQQGTRTPLAQRQEIFQWPVFNAQEDVPTLQALAVADSGKPEVLADMSAVLEIAEEYAAGGIPVLRAVVLDQPGLPIDSLVEYLLDAAKEGKEPGPRV